MTTEIQHRFPGNIYSNLKLVNGRVLRWRDHADTQDIDVLQVDSSNHTLVSSLDYMFFASGKDIFFGVEDASSFQVIVGSSSPTNPIRATKNTMQLTSATLTLNGATVPDGSSATVGNTLRVNSTGVLAYTSLNLAGGANFVFGQLPTSNQALQAMGDNVSGTTAAAIVQKIYNTSIGTSGGSLSTGAVLRVTGSSAADWGAVNLGSSIAVTGVLSASNQAAQSLGGDLSGTTAAATVVGVTGGTSTVTTSTGVHDTRYNATVQTANATPVTILSIAAAKFASFSNIEVMAHFTARASSSASRSFFWRRAGFQNESGTLTQIGTTDTIGIDKTGIALSACSIAVSGNAIVFQVTGIADTLDWSLMVDVQIYGIA